MKFTKEYRKKYNKNYYATKIRPYRVKKPPQLIYVCPFCGLHASSSRFKQIHKLKIKAHQGCLWFAVNFDDDYLKFSYETEYRNMIKEQLIRIIKQLDFSLEDLGLYIKTFSMPSLFELKIIKEGATIREVNKYGKEKSMYKAQQIRGVPRI